MRRKQDNKFNGGTYHWCPKGCGKSVIFTKTHPITNKYVGRGFYCIRCGKKVKKEDIER